MNKNSTLFFILLLFTQLLHSQPVSQTFDGGGTYTYTVPPGYTANVTIQAWGAGGGGGSNTSGAKGGGCGGAYASSTVALGPGSYTVVVGTGGAPGIAGSNSSFSTLVIADGGGSTAGTSGGIAGSSTGSTGNTTILAGAGSSASGNNGGAGGNAGSGGGAGGAGGIANNGAGMPGIVPGGGGGGKAGPGVGSNSGNGADGRVIVTINSVLLPLPVKFNTIKAFEKQQAVQIEWATSAEQNICKYQVERSVDGITFLSIGNVAANNTAGEKHYKFLDPAPLTGINFYRIKSVDMDSRFAFSSIVKINRNKNIHGSTLYPNPISNGTVSFQSADLENGNYSMKLFSPLGSQVYNQTFTHSGGAINLTIQLPTSLQPGMYNIQLATSEKKVMSKKIIIE